MLKAGKYKGREVRDVPITYLLWAVDNGVNFGDASDAVFLRVWPELRKRYDGPQNRARPPEGTVNR
jgi:uncharacterized protein (DUF3820 family)